MTPVLKSNLREEDWTSFCIRAEEGRKSEAGLLACSGWSGQSPTAQTVFRKSAEDENVSGDWIFDRGPALVGECGLVLKCKSCKLPKKPWHYPGHRTRWGERDSRWRRER